MTTQAIITIAHPTTGERLVVTASPWWTDTAFMDGADRICVARVHASGEKHSYMLDLTDDDVAAITAHALFSSLPPAACTTPVSDRRPATNNARRIATARQVQQQRDWLNNDCIGHPSEY